MGLYERLLVERAEEEQRLGGPLPRMRGLDSKVLVRRLEDATWAQPKYAVDLLMMHRLLTRGPRNVGEGMRLGSLKATYREECVELRAEAWGRGSCYRGRLQPNARTLITVSRFSLLCAGRSKVGS